MMLNDRKQGQWDHHLNHYIVSYILHYDQRAGQQGDDDHRKARRLPLRTLNIGRDNLSARQSCVVLDTLIFVFERISFMEA